MEEQPKKLIQTLQIIKEAFQDALTKTFPDIQENITIVSLPFSNKFSAEYQSSTGLKLFNQYKKQGSLGCKNPTEISQKIMDNLDKQKYKFIGDCVVNQQGFINITLSNEFLENYMNTILKYGINMNSSEKHKFAVDFSSPCIAKVMNAGNLRSTIVGDSICRILEECGHEVFRINHLGDWGAYFGMLIERLKEVYPNYLEEKPNLVDFEILYKQAKNRYANDEEFKKKALLNIVNLQKYNKEEYTAWQMICENSRQRFSEIYKKLDIKIIEQGGSFYNKMIPDVLNELREKNLIVEDKGAQCIFVKEGQIPLMVVKSDGGFSCDTTEMAAIKYRLNDLKCDRLLYCNDMGWEPHFGLIFGGAQKAGWLNPPNSQAKHIGLGLVFGPDGQKMKTKEGDKVPLQTLLDKAKKEALDGLKASVKDSNKGLIINLQEEEFEEAAEQIAIGAVKYYDLRQSRTQNYKFDEKKMTDPKGNTAVYLFYSYAKLCSILKQSGFTEEQFKELIENQFKITHDTERELANIIIKMQDIVENITIEFDMHKLADFLYVLAMKLSESYQKYKIIGEEQTKTRILLCQTIKLVMEKAFYMLGIKPLDRL